MNELTNIEQLLEKSGSNDVLGDSNHRYALRRALLRSREFDSNRVSFERWERLWSFTGAVVAGSAVAIVVVFSVSTVITPGGRTLTRETPVAVEVVEVAVEDTEMLAHQEGSPAEAEKIRWADFEQMMTGAHAVVASVR